MSLCSSGLSVKGSTCSPNAQNKWEGRLRPELIMIMSDSDNGKCRRDDWMALSVNHVISAVFVCIIKIWDFSFHSNYSDRRACVWLLCVFACVRAYTLLIGRGMVQAWECCPLRKNKLFSPSSVPLSFSASPWEIGPTWWGGKEKWQDKGMRGGRWHERGWEKGEDVSAWVCVEEKKQHILSHNFEDLLIWHAVADTVVLTDELLWLP